MEGHEWFDINYRKGVAEVTEIVGLCHYCHNFIHSGRLSVIMGHSKSEDDVIDILRYGFQILQGTGLQCFPFTMDLAHDLGVDTWDVEAYQIPRSTVPWEDWRLKLEGKLYKPLFPTMDAWKKHYGHG